MTQQESIVKYSNEILDYLLEFKKSHPDFTFSLRQRDSVQSKEVKRLESGQWFQGSGYIYVPLFKKGDSARKIKTVGFTVEFDKNGTITDNSIEISFKAGIDNEDEILFHQRLASKIGIELNNHNHGFKSFENSQDILSNLHYFITEVRTHALLLLNELGLKEKYVISEAEFQKHLHRINEIKLSGLKSTNPINYWIFQGSPKIYNAVDALNNNAVKTWTVSAHKDKIKKGDQFILWLTGSNAGCYALGTVASEVTMMKEEDAEMGYYLSPTPQVENTRVRIIIDHNFTESPVLWDMIKDDEAFKDFKGSNQGTNFTATKEQYETFLDLASMENDNFEKVLQKFEFEDLKSYFNLLFEIIDTLNLKQGEERLLFTYRKDRLSFTIGQRIALLLLKKHHKGKYFVLTKDKIRPTSENFAGKEPLPFGTYLKELDLVPSERQSVFDGVLQELKRVQRSSYRSKNYSDFEEAVFNPAFRLRFQKITNPIMNYKAPINQILYGPPGTGKTYKLQSAYFDQFTIKESTLSKEQYLENLVIELNWWQVISIAVLDLQSTKVNLIHEHEIVKAKEKISDSKTVRPTIWGQLQRHTILDCPHVNVKDRSEPLYFSKDEDSNWSIDTELLTQYYPEAFELLNKIENFTGHEGVTIKNYEFITFHQSFSYEDFIEGIKPKLEEGETDLNFEIKDGILKKLSLKAEADPTNNYALFIDEINRGNVSAIFGELITLIESDKRIGAKNELKVKLPYSKKEFGVPSNLYIIGTMNTADRSVEALDTALRRRFSFVEMMPESKVIAAKNFKDFDRVNTMLTINKRIELLLDRNHTLGHAYFMKDDFKRSFENEIIPLLQEYFYNDYGKIGLVLGKGFVRVKELTLNNTQSIFADFETKNEVDIVRSYELIPFNEVDFEQAIETLLV